MVVIPKLAPQAGQKGPIAFPLITQGKIRTFPQGTHGQMLLQQFNEAPGAHLHHFPVEWDNDHGIESQPLQQAQLLGQQGQKGRFAPLDDGPRQGPKRDEHRLVVTGSGRTDDLSNQPLMTQVNPVEIPDRHQRWPPQADISETIANLHWT